MAAFLHSFPRRTIPHFWDLVMLPLGAAYGPWGVLHGLPARRPKPRIIRYSHVRLGPARDGHAQRRCRRMFEYSHPAICDDFVATCACVRGDRV